MKGQTLIEVLIALTIAVMIVGAVAIAALSSLSNSQFSKNQNVAMQYAQQGMEISRNLRNSDWNTFKNLNGSYCLDKGMLTFSAADIRNNTIAGCAGGSRTNGQNVDIFARQVDVINPAPAPCNSNQIKVDVKVMWSDGKCSTSDIYCRKVQLTNCFSDLSIQPTP